MYWTKTHECAPANPVTIAVGDVAIVVSRSALQTRTDVVRVQSVTRSLELLFESGQESRPLLSGERCDRAWEESPQHAETCILRQAEKLFDELDLRLMGFSCAMTAFLEP